MRICELARCDVDLDDAGKKATARFCCDAHRAEHHRLGAEGEVTPQASADFWRQLAAIGPTRSRPASREGRPSA